MHRNTHAHREARVLLPAARDNRGSCAASLEELAASLVVSPDDVPLEIEDLASHFLFEATQSTMPCSVVPPPVFVQGVDAALREAFFDEDDGRDQLQEFERIWKHIISREVVSTEL